MTEAIRIAVLNFVHETVTFLPNDTTLDDFVHDGSPARGEALLAWEPRSYMGGFVKVAREHAGVELVGIESPLWPRTGTGSGWITREAYEHFLGRMIAELERGGRWHGVYLVSFAKTSSQSMTTADCSGDRPMNGRRDWDRVRCGAVGQLRFVGSTTEGGRTASGGRRFRGGGDG